MTTVEITLAAPRSDVWDALVDVRTYPTWLIGARRIRAVDEGWPEPGTAFHHVVGLGGPFTIADRTRSVAVVPQQHLELDVRARPLVQATVTFDLSDAAGGTHVVMEEHPTGVHRLVSPLLAPLTQARNRASLERLEDRVRERLAGRPPGG
jgi:uncharacterized protein YndB with AHSA1/START domain